MNIGGSPVSVPKSVHEYWRFACFCSEECASILEVRLFLFRRVCMDIGGSPVSVPKSVHEYWRFACFCSEECA